MTIAEEIQKADKLSPPPKPLDLKDMSDWAHEEDEADKFLEYSQKELDELNK